MTFPSNLNTSSTLEYLYVDHTLIGEAAETVCELLGIHDAGPAHVTKEMVRHLREQQKGMPQVCRAYMREWMMTKLMQLETADYLKLVHMPVYDKSFRYACHHSQHTVDYSSVVIELCEDVDSLIHSANFVLERHRRFQGSAVFHKLHDMVVEQN